MSHHLSYLYCHLDFLLPNLKAKVCQIQCQQKKLHDFHARDPEIVEGDSLFVKNFSPGDPWLPGMLHFKTGPSSFIVDLTDGRRVRRHIDQLRKNTAVAVVDELTTEANDDFPISVPNLPDESPPRDISPSTRKDFELRCSNHTRHPPHRFQVDSFTRRGGVLYVVCTYCIYMLYIYVALGFFRPKRMRIISNQFT